MISKNEPIQYQIIQWLDQRLTKNIKDYTNCNIEDKCARLFSNFRLEQNKPTGIKLTRFGNSLLGRHFDKYDHENDCLLSGKVLLKLDEAMVWPYFVNKKKVVFYSQEDSAWFRLNGSKLESYIDII
jgi:hypothetical protein